MLRDVHDALAGELQVAAMVIGIAALVLPAVLAWRAWPELDSFARQLMAANDPATKQHSNLVERQLDIAQALLMSVDLRTLRDCGTSGTRLRPNAAPTSSRKSHSSR